MRLLFQIAIFLMTSKMLCQSINGIYTLKSKVCDRYQTFKVEIKNDTLYKIISDEKIADTGVIRKKDEFYYFWSNRLSLKFSDDPTRGIPVKITKDKIAMFSRNKKDKLIKTIEAKKVGT